MAEEQKPEKKDEDWMQKKWRPAMGWMYMIVCFCDMIVFPVLWAVLQAIQKVPVTQWDPLTLRGAGLFHVAMGAVLGIAAFGRTQEKLAGTAANTTPTAPAPQPVSQPMSSVSTTPSFMPAPSTSAAVTTGFGGKKAPPEPAFPEI